MPAGFKNSGGAGRATKETQRVKATGIWSAKTGTSHRECVRSLLISWHANNGSQYSSGSLSSPEQLGTKEPEKIHFFPLLMLPEEISFSARSLCKFSIELQYFLSFEINFLGGLLSPHFHRLSLKDFLKMPLCC